MDESNLYRILQVDPAADVEVIDAAFRRLAKKYHPDTGGSEASDQTMSALNHAYEVISNPERRQQYDAEIAASEERARRDQLAAIKRQAASDAQRFDLREALLRATRGGGSSVPRIGRQLSSLADLNGRAIIQAHDGAYLGLISTDRYKVDSICNPYGTHGSRYSTHSVRNNYGTYGGPYGSGSPFNRYSQTPPAIVAGGKIVAYLTVNPYLKPAINPNELLAHYSA